MRMLLLILVFFLIISDALSLDMSLAPGLSIKNALLYVIVLALICRAVLSGEGLKGGARNIQIAFGVLLGYAILSWVVAALLVDYPGYDLVDAGIALKSALVDQLLFFLVFFYGARTQQDALSTLTGMLLAVALVNLITVADVTGLANLGIIEQRDDGRVQGALGEANQYAVFIALFLPAIMAAAASAHGLWRIMWTVAAMISGAALLMTVSRGAFLGLTVAAISGAFLFRKILSARKLVAWGAFGLLLTTAVVLALWVTYGDLLAERLVLQTGSGDLVEVSSGRTQIWATALDRMMGMPLTILTGFGWDVYGTMPFHYAPHNHYLGLWFNLGLPGLACGALLLFMTISRAKQAVESASSVARAQLMAFAFGALALSLAVFFVDLYRPWAYFWAYAGLIMRIAAETEAQIADEPQVAAPSVAGRFPAAASPPRAVHDPYGWIGVRR